MIRITDTEFRVTAAYVYELTGIHLEADKKYLLETRFAGLLEELRCVSFSEFLFRVKSDRSKHLARQVIDAITTNETLFFRDASPFALLRNKLVPELLDRRSGGPGRQRLRVWSAASSSGQEAYSVAITLGDLLGDLSRYDIKILGTDISSNAVARASAGTYNLFEVERGMPPGVLERHFIRNEAQWTVRAELRRLCTFHQRNLHEPFTTLGRFDIILCRNVAIYFKPDDRRSLFDRLGGALEPHGALLVGSSEFLTGVSERFVARRHGKTVYYEKAA